MKKLSLNLGHVTNSSAMVYWFPKEVLEDPEIKAFLEAFDLGDGWVGKDLTCRSGCMSFLRTKEQKEQAKKDFLGEEDGGSWGAQFPQIDPDDDSSVVVIYGDEYENPTTHLADLLKEACVRLGLTHPSADFL